MKEIPLTQGKVALVDDEDYERCAIYKWHAIKSKSRTTSRVAWYARRFVSVCNELGVRRQQAIYLHRFIMNAPPDKEVDHKNRDGLDCQRKNLRLATRSQNAINKPRDPRARTRFKGVMQDGPKWYPRIYLQGKHVRFSSGGGFDSPEEAARIYDQLALKYFGEFAYLNFPESRELYASSR
jgi:HNH endonuclease